MTPIEVQFCQASKLDTQRRPAGRCRGGGVCRAPVVGPPRFRWLELFSVAGPGGLPRVGECPSGAEGTGLGMCGDIHLNPGPLHTAVANVTSLRLHAAEVAPWEVDLIFL